MANQKNKVTNPISLVEKIAVEKSGQKILYAPTEKINTIMVENFPSLGNWLLCAL